jgi:site-specific recombinase XerD
VAALTRRFGGWRAVNITTAEIRTFVERRRLDGHGNGSINRELAALKWMFRLAVRDEILERALHIPMLPEAPPRAGFFEAEQFEAVLRQLPSPIRPVALVGYELGLRLRKQNDTGTRRDHETV